MVPSLLIYFVYVYYEHAHDNYQYIAYLWNFELLKI
jgi:hypothetical protein